jgi:hypothetical protein
MRIVRRFIPQLGFLTVAGFVWNHRGTARRVVDLAVDVPQILRDDGLDGVVQQGKVLFELDRTRPTDMKVRLPEPGARAAAQPA